MNQEYLESNIFLKKKKKKKKNPLNQDNNKKGPENRI